MGLPSMLAMGLGLLALTPGHVTRMQGLCWRTAEPFSTPEPVGLDALAVGFPAGVPFERQRFSITAVRFGPEASSTKAGMTPGELRAYVRSIFLAAGPGGGPIRRTLLGSPVDGDSFTTSIPRPRLGEIYALPLASGETVVLGFSMPVEARAQGEALLTEVVTTLREADNGDPSCGGSALRLR
ncbi:hypothetical protein [Synechococcus sp. CBW1006]|uniref:hypothetical protein n=1 Tax=Synechococcus sp. CBW1006 TaxID=1353138 RepID=UPI0018CDD2DB|nr:hypothetical protein [Synechococcus sp. CBW1006]QPN67775.1 hypothetical protein H8F26_06450 [Synechococcus sp. CBW1006]